MKPSIARILLVLAALALPAIAAAPAVRDAAAAGRQAKAQREDPGAARVIVKYRADGGLMREAARAARGGREPEVQHAVQLAQRLGIALADGHAIAPRTQVLHARGLRSSELVARLLADPDVETAEVDQRVHIAAAPNDPRYPGGQTSITPEVGQWYLRAPDSTFVSAIDAETAWNITHGSPAIVVAVLDTGVRPDHPDLAGKLLPGYDFVSADSPGVFSTANDGDGRDADPSDPGDWITAADVQAGGPFAGCEVVDSSWHGTQTAGLIGAATDNGIGMASVGRNVRVLPVRVLGKCGGYLSDVVAGMRWAAGLSSSPVANPNPARIVNLSLGSIGSCAGTAYESAVNELVAAGVVVVAAAGNDTGHAVGRPANCNGVIGVGGLRHIGTKVGFSDVGPEISISAPAGNCVNLAGSCQYPLLTTINAGTTTPGANTYSSGGNDASIGTSFSAPLVAGTVALMLSVNPSQTPAQVRSALISSARAFPSAGADPGTPVCVAPNGADQLECYCTTSTCGAGMLNAAGAVALAAGRSTLTVQITATPTTPVAGATVMLDGSASFAPAGRTITGYQWTLVGGSTIARFSGATNAATASVLTTAAGSFTARLTITDSSNATASADVTLTVAEVPPVPIPLTAQITATPTAPVAGATVMLDGSASFAPAGRTITGYQWTLVGGSTIARFSGATNAATASVLTTAAGSFTARLTITDSSNATASADVTLTVAEVPPVPIPLTAQITATPTAPVVGATVMLDGSASFAPAGRTIAGYQWTLLGDSTIARFSGATNAATASVLTTATGIFTARLTITDSAGAQAYSDTAITVVEPPPPPPPSSGGGGALQLGWALALLAAVLALARSR